MVTKTEFLNTNYHNGDNYVIPLLNIKLEKSNYFTDGKHDINKLYEHAEKLYRENEDKFL